jgi:predicted DCC family thiol-disulfide oxidoreductase YuxK
MAMKAYRKLVEFFSLDYRSLALMRFGMGLLILLDLADRAQSLVAHYSDAGTLSRADVLTLYGNKFLISLHMMSGLALVQATLFIIAAVFAIMLMVGYRTRLATIVSWFLLISLQARNPMVLQGGDIAFRVVLFWMLFLPTRKPKEGTTFASPATLAYIVQIVLIYVMSGILKTGAAWHDGTAVYYALSVDQLARPLGEHLRTWRGITHFLTHATRNLELYGSLLYFVPWKTGLFRTLGVLFFALMQIGFNLSMHLGLFGAISIVITLGLLPPYFWDSLLASRRKPGLAIYYDSACGFCQKVVHGLKNFLFLAPSTKLEAADRQDSWLVVDADGGEYLGFDGVATVVAYSPVFFWLAPVFRLPGVRNIGQWCYEKVASHRSFVCLPEPIEKKPSRLLSAAIIFLTIYIVLWNMNTPLSNKALRSIGWIGWTTRLDQAFNMFAPTPLTEDGWYVIPGMLQNGTQVDLFRSGPMLSNPKLFPVSYQKPKHVADGYPDQRWQKYLMNIAEADNSRYRLAYGQYLCRTWNKDHTGGETLETFKMLFMIENTPPEGLPNPAPIVTTLWEHRCF